eukprot:15470240-Alexandrium_andersonii.AAC.1
MRYASAADTETLPAGEAEAAGVARSASERHAPWNLATLLRPDETFEVLEGALGPGAPVVQPGQPEEEARAVPLTVRVPEERAATSRAAPGA